MHSISSKSQEKMYILFEIIDSLIKNSNNEKSKMFPISCLLRIREIFLSAIKLLEEDLIHEAESSMRIAFETTVWLFAFFKLESNDFENRRRLNYKVNKLNTLKTMKRYGHTYEGNIDNDINELTESINDLSPKSRRNNRIKIEENYLIAKECGLDKLRGVYYSTLCKSTHPTIQSFMRYIKLKDDTIEYDISPIKKDDVELISEIIYNISLLIIALLNESYNLGIIMKLSSEILNEIN